MYMNDMFLPPSRYPWYLLQTKPHQESKVFGVLEYEWYDSIFFAAGVQAVHGIGGAGCVAIVSALFAGEPRELGCTVESACN
jgi:hypothetical protein